MQASPLITLSPSSPSFNSCSSGKLAEIAARVVQEFSNEVDEYFPDSHENDSNSIRQNQSQNNEEDHDDDEFEFAVVYRETDGYLSAAADDIFYNGQIRPIYPLFDTSLILDPQEKTSSLPSNKPKRLPLRKLFSEERDTSCSSSEAYELDGVAPGTYCVWTPKKTEEEKTPGRCKKSSSTGTSKRWKIKDLLYRSNSDGKDTIIFLTPSKKHSNSSYNNDEEDKQKGKGMKVVVPVEEHDARNRSIKDADKRRSFLPYRQDLLGFLSNVNGMGKNLHPF